MLNAFWLHELGIGYEGPERLTLPPATTGMYADVSHPRCLNWYSIKFIKSLSYSHFIFIAWEKARPDARPMLRISVISASLLKARRSWRRSFNGFVFREPKSLESPSGLVEVGANILEKSVDKG